jgi:hypothetical protein
MAITSQSVHQTSSAFKVRGVHPCGCSEGEKRTGKLKENPRSFGNAISGRKAA